MLHENQSSQTAASPFGGHTIYLLREGSVPGKGRALFMQWLSPRERPKGDYQKGGQTHVAIYNVGLATQLSIKGD